MVAAGKLSCAFAVVASATANGVTAPSSACLHMLSDVASQGRSDVELAAFCRASLPPQFCQEATSSLGQQPWAPERMAATCKNWEDRWNAQNAAAAPEREAKGAKEKSGKSGKAVSGDEAKGAKEKSGKSGKAVSGNKDKKGAKGKSGKSGEPLFFGNWKAVSGDEDKDEAKGAKGKSGKSGKAVSGDEDKDEAKGAKEKSGKSGKAVSGNKDKDEAKGAKGKSGNSGKAVSGDKDKEEVPRFACFEDLQKYLDDIMARKRAAGICMKPGKDKPMPMDKCIDNKRKTYPELTKKFNEAVNNFYSHIMSKSQQQQQQAPAAAPRNSSMGLLVGLGSVLAATTAAAAGFLRFRRQRRTLSAVGGEEELGNVSEELINE